MSFSLVDTHIGVSPSRAAFLIPNLLRMMNKLVCYDSKDCNNEFNIQMQIWLGSFREEVFLNQNKSAID